MALTDVHVHLGALPTAANGCLVSRRLLRRPSVRLITWRLGLPLDEPERANRLYLERLDGELGRSRRIARAVLLALDGAYDGAGRLDEARTDILMSNDAVFAAAASFPRLLPGASINPRRRDALDELERCAERGARLVKVLPNTQGFDPADARFARFYRRLAELGLPLLVHVGFEFSLSGAEQSYGDLARWRSALEEGAPVIAAHGCSSGTFLREPHLPVMAEFVRRFPRFYVDTSALTLPSRFPALLRLRRHPEVFERLLFGTDFPLPCLSWGLPGARAADNRFDRQAQVLESMGLPVGRDFFELRF